MPIAAHTTVIGSGINNVTIGNITQFSIIPRDAIGNLLSNYSDIFTISISPANISIINNTRWVNNTIVVRVNFTQIGIHQINIFAYGDVPIRGSPFTVQVTGI